MQWRYSYLCQAIGAITTPLTLPPFQAVEEGEGADHAKESPVGQDERSSNILTAAQAEIPAEDPGQESNHDPDD